MTALLSLLWAVLRTPVGAGLIAFAIGYGYGGVKWHARGVEEERAAQIAALAAKNRSIDELNSALAEARAAEARARDEAFDQAVASLGKGEGFIISPELAKQLNTKH